MFSQDDLLTAGVFYELSGAGLSYKASAKIVKLIPPDTWQDARDGFIRYMIVPISGQGGATFAFDLEELSGEPAATVSLVIDLKGVLCHVVQRVAETYEQRRQRQGFE